MINDLLGLTLMLTCLMVAVVIVWQTKTPRATLTLTDWVSSTLNDNGTRTVRGVKLDDAVTTVYEGWQNIHCVILSNQCHFFKGKGKARKFYNENKDKHEKHLKFRLRVKVVDGYVRTVQKATPDNNVHTINHTFKQVKD